MGHLWDRFRWTILFPAISFPPNSHVRSGPCASPRVACEVVHLSHGTRDSGSRPGPRGAVVCEASAAYPHAMAIALRSHGLLIARKVGEPKQDSANRSCHYTNPNRNLSIRPYSPGQGRDIGNLPHPWSCTAWACPTCPNGTTCGTVSRDHPFSGYLLSAKFAFAIKALRVASRGVRGCPSVPCPLGHGTADRGQALGAPRGPCDV